MARGKSREKANILQRQLTALDLRKAGWTFRQIAAKCEVDVSTAYSDVMTELRRLSALKTESTEDYRQLELERCDVLIKGLEPMAAVGNPESVRAYVKVMERRAKLLGLDMPAKVAHTDPSGENEFAGLIVNLGSGS